MRRQALMISLLHGLVSPFGNKMEKVATVWVSNASCSTSRLEMKSPIDPPSTNTRIGWPLISPLYVRSLLLSPLDGLRRSAGWSMLPTAARVSAQGARRGGEGLDGLASIGAFGPTEYPLFLTRRWFPQWH